MEQTGMFFVAFRQDQLKYICMIFSEEYAEFNFPGIA